MIMRHGIVYLRGIRPHRKRLYKEETIKIIIIEKSDYAEYDGELVEYNPLTDNEEYELYNDNLEYDEYESLRCLYCDFVANNEVEKLEHQKNNHKNITEVF